MGKSQAQKEREVQEFLEKKRDSVKGYLAQAGIDGKGALQLCDSLGILTNKDKARGRSLSMAAKLIFKALVEEGIMVTENKRYYLPEYAPSRRTRNGVTMRVHQGRPVRSWTDPTVIDPRFAREKELRTALHGDRKAKRWGASA